MDGIKILHTGDLHLGMPFTGSRLPSTVGRIRRQELWETFDRIIKIAKQEKVHLLLISGDLFEYDYCSMSDIKRINDRFAQIPGTRVFIAPGNHDPAVSDSLYNTCRWQPNVHVFRESRVSAVKLEDYNTVVWGLGWDKARIREPLLEGFEADAGAVNILAVHCDVVPVGSASDYLPVYSHQLAGCGVNYAALGHIHKGGRINKSGGTEAVYCGSPEPLDFTEEGRHGIYMGTVGTNFCDVKFIETAKRRFVTERITLDPSSTQDTILEEINKHIQTAGRDNLFKFLLEGSVDPGFEPDTEYLRNAFETFYTEIKNNTLPGYDLDSIREEGKHSITGVFAAQLLGRIKRETDPTEKEILERALYIGLDALNGRKVTGR